jgi:hypothetical protein
VYRALPRLGHRNRLLFEFLNRVFVLIRGVSRIEDLGTAIGREFCYERHHPSPAKHTIDAKLGGVFVVLLLKQKEVCCPAHPALGSPTPLASTGQKGRL